MTDTDTAQFATNKSLETSPAYWRGRARTRHQFADEGLRLGSGEDPKPHLLKAAEYEAKAAELARWSQVA